MNRSRLFPAVALALFCLSEGCADGLTEMVVTVDTDGSFVASEVTLTVDGEPIGAEASMRRTTELPLVVSVVHRGGSYGPIELTARGTDTQGNEFFAEARAFFVPNVRTSAALTLSSDCPRCASGESCVDGMCTPVVFNPMDASAMSDAVPSDVRMTDVTMSDATTRVDAMTSDAALDTGNPDAGNDAGVMDAGNDAGTDAGGMCSMPLPCAGDCRCREEEECGSCAYTCAPGVNCKPHCDSMCSVVGTDARKVDVKCHADCTVSGNGADEIKVECSRGSRCDVDCRGVETCEVDCKSDEDECTLRCDDGADCGFKSCDDAEACGGVLYCNIDGACDD